MSEGREPTGLPVPRARERFGQADKSRDAEGPAGILSSLPTTNFHSEHTPLLTSVAMYAVSVHRPASPTIATTNADRHDPRRLLSTFPITPPAAPPAATASRSE